MSLFEQSSICITPNGTKASKLYAIKPTSGAGDLSVTRATTATRVNSAGLIESVASNVPRLDYTNSSCPSILVEPQRTNLATYSEQFNDASWEKAITVSISANSIVSPDGNTTADTVTCNGVGLLFTRKVAYLGTTQKCSNSIYAKKGNTRYFAFRNYGDLGGLYDVFDFDTKTWTQNSASVLSFEELDNGWFRLTSVNSDTLGNYYFSFFPTENTSGAEFDSVTNKNVYVWGAQAEIGSYATSYIPTVASAVTRNADVISKTGISSLIGQTEGTILWDIYIETPTATDNENILNIDNGSFGNTIYFIKSGSATFTAEMYLSGSVQASFTKTGIVKGRYKCAFAYANNNTAFFINGVQVGSTDTSCGVPATSRLQLGQGALGSSTGNINLTALWKTRLTNAELAEITTL